jgi:hypothetical protein
MNARSARLNEAKAEEIKLQALEAAEKVVIEAKVDNDTDGEALESVNLPENPGAHGGGGRGR